MTPPVALREFSTEIKCKVLQDGRYKQSNIPEQNSRIRVTGLNGKYRFAKETRFNNTECSLSFLGCRNSNTRYIPILLGYTNSRLRFVVSDTFRNHPNLLGDFFCIQLFSFIIVFAKKSSFTLSYPDRYNSNCTDCFFVCISLSEYHGSGFSHYIICHTNDSNSLTLRILWMGNVVGHEEDSRIVRH